MQFFKSGVRRLEQGLLEQIGATTSSKDATFDQDDQRYKRLEDSLQRLNAAVLIYVGGLKKACEDGRELVSVVDFFASADVKHGVVPSSSEAVHFLDALQSMLRVHTGIKAAVARSVETMMTERVIAPLGALLRALPTLKRHMDARRQMLTDYDSYVRRLEALSRGDGGDDSLAKAESKVAAARAALGETKAVVASLLAEAEQRRAALLQEAAYTFAACAVHFHRHAADVVSPLLPLFPGAASVLADLAGHTHVAAAAARPKGFIPVAGGGPAGAGAPVAGAGVGGNGMASSLRAAMAIPRGALMESDVDTEAGTARRIPGTAAAKTPFGALHAGVMATGGKDAVAAAAAAATAVKSSTAGTRVAAAATRAVGTGPEAAVATSRALSARPEVYARATGPAGAGAVGGFYSGSDATAAPAPAGPVYGASAAAAGGAGGPSAASSSAAGGGSSSSAASSAPGVPLRTVSRAAVVAAARAGSTSGGASPSGLASGSTGGPGSGSARALPASPGDDLLQLSGAGGGSGSGISRSVSGFGAGFGTAGAAAAVAATGPGGARHAASGSGSGGSGSVADLASLFGGASPAAAGPGGGSTPSASAGSAGGGVARPGAATAAAAASMPPGRIAEVKFDFGGPSSGSPATGGGSTSPAAPDELSLRRGQLLEVLRRDEEGWWSGRVLTDAPASAGASSRGTVGAFPFNYVRVLSPAEASAAAARLGMPALAASGAGGSSGSASTAAAGAPRPAAAGSAPASASAAAARPAATATFASAARPASGSGSGAGTPAPPPAPFVAPPPPPGGGGGELLTFGRPGTGSTAATGSRAGGGAAADLHELLGGGSGTPAAAVPGAPKPAGKPASSAPATGSAGSDFDSWAAPAPAPAGPKPGQQQRAAAVASDDFDGWAAPAPAPAPAGAAAGGSSASRGPPAGGAAAARPGAYSAPPPPPPASTSAPAAAGPVASSVDFAFPDFTQRSTASVFTSTWDGDA